MGMRIGGAIRCGAKMLAAFLAVAGCVCVCAASDVQLGPPGQATPLMASHAADSVARVPLRAMSLSSDGHWLLFVKRTSDQSPPGLWMRDNRSGAVELLDLGSWIPIADGARSPGLSWSSDSRFVAIAAHDANSSARWIVYDRIAGRVTWIAPLPLCPLAECLLWRPIWLADSSKLVWVAGKEISTARAEAKDGVRGNDRRARQDEMLGITRSNEGIFLQKSAALLAAAEAGEASAREVFPLQSETLVALSDVASGTTRFIASGASFVGTIGSNDGRRLVAVALNPRDRPTGLTYAIYDIGALLSHGSSDPGSSPKVQHADALVARMSNAQFGRSVNLSSSGRWLAYTSTGVEGSGDVHVLDIGAGTDRNLTELSTPGINALDMRPGLQAGQRYLLWHGKFGSANFGPIWSRDERHIFVTRAEVVSEGKSFAGFPTLRTELWRIPIDGGEPARVDVPHNLSIEGLAVCPSVQQACAIGPEGEIVLKLRAMDSQQWLLGAIKSDSATFRVIGPIGAAPAVEDPDQLSLSGVADEIVATDAGAVAGLFEGNDVPPDIWSVALNARASKIGRLRILNRNGLPPSVRKLRVQWTDTFGRKLGATLQLPSRKTGKRKLPVIVEVYGGAYLSAAADGLYGLGDTPFSWLAASGEFALLQPDLPTSPQVNSGQTCDGFAENVVNALNAAEATGEIDTARAGVIGHSWGGYTVNCIITRTTRFRAAISVAGLSNILSLGTTAGGNGTYKGLMNIDAWPWEKPQIYVSENPLFYLDRIQTPLMIVYGKRDLIEPNHPKEMFDGMVAAGKAVALVGYDDSAHVGMLGDPDFRRRALSWFHEYLRAND